MIRQVMTILIFLFFSALPLAAAGDSRENKDPVQEIILWEHLWPDRDLIHMLLAPTTKDYGPYKLVKSLPMAQGRAILSLINNDLVNILFLPTSKKREGRLLPVYIYMGDAHLGYRVCLIRKGTASPFKEIASLSDWQASGLVMGTGTHWADTPILEANRLKVAKAPEDKLLYSMLAHGRFQCFPRGISQLQKNLEKYGSKGSGFDLEVEKHLLFTYPFFSILFVSPKNPELKQRLLDGHAKVVADGTWKARFQKSRNSQNGMYQTLHLKQRTIIPLENPFMSRAAMEMDIRGYAFDPLE